MPRSRVVAGAMEKLTSEAPAVTVTPLATVRSYDELHAALRARADELRVTRLGMDEVGGMPPGYFGKVLAPEQIKLVGKHSLGALLGVLGCMLIMIEDPEARARFTARIAVRKFNADYLMLTMKPRRFAGFLGDSQWGKEARKVGLLKISTRRRKQVASHAAKVRWAKHRARHRDVRDRPK